jgi:hypothetical protein
MLAGGCGKKRAKISGQQPKCTHEETLIMA